MAGRNSDRRIEVAIAVILRDGQVLICRRRQDDTFGGYWEFPGGKREPGETIEQALAREVREETGLRIERMAPLDVIDHAYPAGRLRLHPFVCRASMGDVAPHAADEVRWVGLKDLATYRFPPANEGLIAKLADGGLAQEL